MPIFNSVYGGGGGGGGEVFQEVEYIQSTGTQYLVIGNSFSTDYKVEIDLQLTATGGDQVLFGCIDNYHKFGINAYSSNFKATTGGNSWSNTKSEDANRHTFIMDKGTIYVDGDSYSSSYESGTFSFGLGLFSYNRAESSSRFPAEMKLFSCKIYNGSTILYDLVPCYRKSDNEIGMYDSVNDTFYTNRGTGTFIKGPNKSDWQPDPSRTIFYYDFEDSNNRLKDSSGSNNNATSASNISYVEVGGQYVAQTTGNGGINIPGSYGSSINTGDFTMSCWFYTINPGSGLCPQLFSSSYDASSHAIIWFDPINKLSDSVPTGAGVKREMGNDGYHRGTTDITTLYNGWHHFVMTRNSGTVTCYIDTNVDVTWSSSTAFPNSGTGCLIGRANSSWQYFGAGAKGDKFILEKVGWSITDITNYYNQTKSIYGL